jgi:hypothetical protein
VGRSLPTDIVDWLSDCKYGFTPYLQNNWTLYVSTIVTFCNYDYNLPNQPLTWPQKGAKNTKIKNSGRVNSVCYIEQKSEF